MYVEISHVPFSWKIGKRGGDEGGEDIAKGEMEVEEEEKAEEGGLHAVGEGGDIVGGGGWGGRWVDDML